MKHNATQTKNDQVSNELKGKKIHNKKLIVIISMIVAAVIIAVSAVLYVNLYKIPHDKAVTDYNEAVNNYNGEREQYDAAVAALSEKNKAFDDAISSLSQLINTENIPLDEFLIEEPKTVLQEARGITKDSAPEVSEMPTTTKDVKKESIKNIETVTNEIIDETSKITELIPKVQEMGDYSDTIELLTTTEEKYKALIDQFEGCKADVVWYDVDEEESVLRFVVELSNPNSYPLRGVTTEWIAYDENDAIVGSFDGTQPDIPANGKIYYVGGAGSANLNGTPSRVEVKVTYDGLMTNRELPEITVSNEQIKDNGFNWFTVSADCVTDSDIQSVDLDCLFILKDESGQIVGAEFGGTDNLPDSIGANGKFTISEDFFDLPTVPATAEIQVCYIMQ